MNLLTLDELSTIRDNVVKELENAASGGKTSFKYIKNSLPTSNITDATIQVIVIGGTLAKLATVKITQGNPSIISLIEKQQPSLLTDENFYSFIEDSIDPDVSYIALNFAYPLQPVINEDMLDGILISGTKENTFTGLVGKTVGRSVEDYLFKRFEKKIRVCVANDTVCLVLSGLTKWKWTDIVGGVLGTGINFAIFQDESTIINLEAAFFSRFPQSPTGIQIDKESKKPGAALFEKETAGAYLFRHYNLLRSEYDIRSPEIRSTKEVTKLAGKNNNKEGQLASFLLQKSAMLVASEITGITCFQKRSLCFVMEGNFFWGSKTYRSTIEKYVSLLCPDYHISFAQIKHSEIFGAAELFCHHTQE